MLALKVQSKIVADILYHFLEKMRHFVWIVCWADDSHEMRSLIFSEKYNKKHQTAVSCCYDQHLMS